MEQEALYALAVMGTKVTGIDNILWFIPMPEGRSGPKIKVAIDSPHAKRPGGKAATVPFDMDESASGELPPMLEQKVR